MLFRQFSKRSIKQELSSIGFPRVTTTRNGHPGDALNVVLIGRKSDIERFMKTAKWHSASPLNWENDIKIGVDTILDRPFEDAPISDLFLYGRREDLAFEQAVGHSPRHRHHIRLWQSDVTSEDGRPVWIGAASYDIGVGLSHVSGMVTHRIASDIDAERKYFFDCGEQANGLTMIHKIDGFQTNLSGKNGGGDPWETDGTLWVGVLVMQKN